MRCRIIVPTSFRLVFLRQSISSADMTFDSTNTILTTQVVMHFSLMAATFPCMRKFLQAFDLNMGATTKMETEIGGGSLSSSFHLKSIDSGKVRQPTRPVGQ